MSKTFNKRVVVDLFSLVHKENFGYVTSMNKM